MNLPAIALLVLVAVLSCAEWAKDRTPPGAVPSTPYPEADRVYFLMERKTLPLPPVISFDFNQRPEERIGLGPHLF